MARISDVVSGDFQTTDATQSNAKSYTLPDGCVARATIDVVARNTSDGTSKSWSITAGFKRHAGGSAVLLGESNQSAGDLGAALWGATMGVSGNDIQTLVTGALSTTIEWSVWISIKIRTT